MAETGRVVLKLVQTSIAFADAHDIEPECCVVAFENEAVLDEMRATNFVQLRKILCVSDMEEMTVSGKLKDNTPWSFFCHANGRIERTKPL